MAHVIGHETRPARCPMGHVTTVELDLYWNPWGQPDGCLPGPAFCHCGARTYPVARSEAALMANRQDHVPEP